MFSSADPLITIITVVFNGEKTIEQTIRSVLNQSYKNIEYIIIDGLSTDGTLEVITPYNDKITVISEADEGLYDAMNKGIKMASGDIIGIVNSDDWLEYNAVQLVAEAAKNKGKEIFHGNIHLIKENGKIDIRKFNPSPIKFIYYGMTYLHPAMFVRKEVYERHLYNTKLSVFSDYQFILTNFLESPAIFYYINATLSNYRLGGESTQQPFFHALKEGWIARKNSHLPLAKNFASLMIRFFLRGIMLTKHRMLGQ